MILKNLTRNTCLAINCEVADNFFTRFIGLMGRRVLRNGSCLIITPCNSIHMLFMRFSLDVIFVDKCNTIVYQLEDLKPWRISRIVWQAVSTIELPVGTIKMSGTKTGDKLIIEA